MLSYEDALSRILGAAQPLPAERTSLADAGGRTLAEPILAAFDQPPFRASAMDGYAVRWSDLPGPWRQIGESAAGKPFRGTLGAGETVRIFTGAPVPEAADTVIVQEDMEKGAGGAVELHGNGPPEIGAHIRPRGNDFNAGAILLEVGTRLTPPALALAAAAGAADLATHRQPRIAIIATGDELVPPGTPAGPGQIVGSSGVMIAEQLRRAGATVDDFGIVPDDRTAIATAISKAAGHDLVITIGGASVGDHDLVKDALAAEGAEIDFWRIAIRPGKPLIHGRLGSAHFIGLPGNPVSAFICTRLFAVPLVLRLSGAEPRDHLRTARLTVPLPPNGGRRDHMRAVQSDDRIAPLSMQDSSQLRALTQANALIVREPHAHAAEAGDTVHFIPLDSA